MELACPGFNSSVPVDPSGMILLDLEDNTRYIFLSGNPHNNKKMDCEI
jgi:hypothetical protein